MHTFHRYGKARLGALATAFAFALTAGGASAVNQSNEKRNMKRVGHTDLQGRPAYQPNIIQYPDGRYIAFVGMHSGVPVPVPACPSFLPNPLNGNACENNGTMIIDVSDPRNPVEKALIPSPSTGQSQSVRMCLGSQLPGGTPGKVYMMRNNTNPSGYQVWDVTDVTAPVLKSSLTGLRSTHKHWWECNTGIVYLPGSKNAAPLWRQSQSMLVYDWSNPNAAPVYIRTFGLPGGQPGSTGTVATSLHGAISAYEHPQATQPLAAWTNAGVPAGTNVVGNRIYTAWGVGDNGVMTIIDRMKLLPAPWGTWVPTATNRDSPAEAELIGPNSPTVGYYLMSPDQGGHTSFPIFGMQPPSYAKFNEFRTRDIVLLASEATADGVDGRCNESPHWSFVVDVTVENSMTVPPGTRVQHDPYQGPMGLSTMSVDERAGDKFKRGNYCGRGARFGVHSSEENFRNPMYGKLTSIAYFNGGVRMWDIREPQAPKEVAFYVPESNAKTDPDGYMTNNVEIDNRGYVYIVDRNGAGFDILELTGCAKQVVEKGKFCTDLDNDNAD
ncbi:MAG: hypothetical protein ABIO45_05610 [Burkholderiaceae bacterium]